MITSPTAARDYRESGPIGDLDCATPKPGIYFFIAEDEPPLYVIGALEALQQGGLSVTIGSGYRGFYEEKKADDPNFRGFPMTPEQTYLVVIGPKPRE